MKLKPLASIRLIGSISACCGSVTHIRIRGARAACAPSLSHTAAPAAPHSHPRRPPRVLAPFTHRSPSCDAFASAARACAHSSHTAAPAALRFASVAPALVHSPPPLPPRIRAQHVYSHKRGKIGGWRSRRHEATT